MRGSKIRIIVILLLLLLLIEIFIRIYVAKELAGLNYYDPGIENVPYTHIDFDKISLNKEKPRIVIIGDYISIHKSIELNKDLGEILYEKLNISYEIINTGETFYSIPEELGLLSNKVFEFKPDIIVINYIYNDIDLENSKELSVPLEIKRDIYKPKILTFKIISYLEDKVPEDVSGLYSNTSEWIDRYYNAYTSNNSHARILYINYLHEIEAIKLRENATILFTITPIFYPFSDKRLEATDDFLFSECKKTKLICVDMLKRFKKYDFREVKEDDSDIWHPNAKGIELISQTIYDSIQDIDT